MKNLFFLFLLSFSLLSINACKNKPAGEEANIGAAQETSAATGKTHAVDLSTSKVLWEGVKPDGKHNGTINLKSGTISAENGVVTGGSFVLDMATISALDLTGEYKTKLEDHLKGTGAEGKEDFFNTTKYPEAKFEITKVTSITNDPDATNLVYGNLTLKDITKEVGFKAKINVTDSGISVTTPQFTINRTDWGIKYGSKTFFNDLKDKFIEDNMGIQINLSAK